MPTPPPTEEANLAKGIPSFLTALAWLMLVGARAFAGVGEALVALGIAAAVPLGLLLASRVRCPQNVDARATRRTEMVRRAVALASPLGMASFAFPAGATAAMLATPWLLATVLVGLLGLSRLVGLVGLGLLRRGPRPVAVLALDVGCLYLPIGGAWYWASRAGISPLGFHEPVVLFTAAHFHFAGFAAPVVAGLVGVELGLGSPSADTEEGGPEAVPTSLVLRRAHGLSACVVMGGVPLVAVGITVSHELEAPAGMLLGAGMLILASLLALTGLRRLFGPSRYTSPDRGPGRLVSFQRRSSGLLFVLSGLSLVGSMTLAIAFTLTGSAGRGAEASWIPYATMAAFHGIANAVGFAGFALLGFLLWAPARTPVRPSAVSAERGPIPS